MLQDSSGGQLLNESARISPWSLMFDNAVLEQGFRQRQHTVWASNELRNLMINLMAGIINLSITVSLLVEGSIFTVKAAKMVLPYMAVAAVHWCLVAYWQRWPAYRDNAGRVAEVCYFIICCLSMPTWVLHGAVSDAKTFFRKWILGSGILIGYWCRFLIPSFFFTARWLVPLQFGVQGFYLAVPTCATLEASQYGMQAARHLSRLLDQFSATTLGGSCPVHACRNSVYMLQLVAGGTLLYSQYRMERTNRLAYLQDNNVRVEHDWPCMPGYVQVFLHCLLYTELLAGFWLLLQCPRLGVVSIIL
eukprot:gene3932-4186_t